LKHLKPDNRRHLKFQPNVTKAMRNNKLDKRKAKDKADARDSGEFSGSIEPQSSTPTTTEFMGSTGKMENSSRLVPIPFLL